MVMSAVTTLKYGYATYVGNNIWKQVKWQNIVDFHAHQTAYRCVDVSELCNKLDLRAANLT